MLKWVKKIKGRHGKSTPLTVFVMVALAGYLIFFTSKLWLPAAADYINATPYYEAVKYGDYDIYLSQWDYAPGQDAGIMEVLIEFENSGTMDSQFAFSAVEKNHGELSVKAVQETPEYAFLRITGLNPKWTEISLRIEARGNKSPAKFYTNKTAVHKVKALPVLGREEYQEKRLKSQIVYDDFQAKEKHKEISQLQAENGKMDERIDRLQKETYLSDAEVEKAKEAVSKAKNQIAANEGTIKTLQGDVEKLKERTDKIRKLLDGGPEKQTGQDEKEE